MPTDLITYETARERIKAVSDERPDYVNAVPIFGEDDETVVDHESCVYFNDDGSPSCIVGTAFAVELTDADVHAGASANTGGVFTLLNDGILQLTPRAGYFLQSVQVAQDQGATWSEAYRQGVERAGYRTETSDLDDDRPSSGHDF